MRPIFRWPTPRSVLFFCALAVAMILMNLALPRHEPVAFMLLFAALVCGRNPYAAVLAYLLSSITALSWMATLSMAAQGCILLLAFVLSRTFRREPGPERIAYAAAAQIPFIFLFPHEGYALLPFPVIAQKCILALFFLLAALLAEGGMRALLFRVFRCRLSGAELAQIGLLWLFLGMGLYAGLGAIVFTGVTLFLLLAAVTLAENSAAVPLAVALALPACVYEVSLLPVAVYAVYACAALLLHSYGRIAAALTMTLTFLGVQYFLGLYTQDAVTISLTILACVLPALVVALLPGKIVMRAKRSLLFYRERVLPRIAVNRNRRAVGEQLYEVSSLFREIESAFLIPETTEDADRRIARKITSTLCANCTSYASCSRADLGESFLRLVRVGRAKGKVNLVDLPAELAKHCSNVAGVLFALNKELVDYCRVSAAMDTARAGRELLARQAHGISEILKDIALRESEEYAVSGGEDALARALQEHGILSSEIFVYGEDDTLTVSMTLSESVPAKKVCAVASEALGVPLALSEKLPLTHDRACFILTKKPRYDASFGLAGCPKAGERASGDTHSILKIDERRFLVALSDGMGSGASARDVSARTLSLLESFYKTKMPSETVLATVNSLIAFSADETFSCLDLAAVNLDTGCADIVKIGSPAGFLLTEGTLKILEGESLPIGMLETIRPATMRVTMCAGDFLIFMSDGVTAAFASSADLCAYLSTLRPLNPQALAENILTAALGRVANHEPPDDMTVLTVKLTENA